MFSSLVLVESKSSFFVSYICLKKNQFNIVGNLYKSFFLLQFLRFQPHQKAHFKTKLAGFECEKTTFLTEFSLS